MITKRQEEDEVRGNIDIGAALKGGGRGPGVILQQKVSSKLRALNTLSDAGLPDPSVRQAPWAELLQLFLLECSQGRRTMYASPPMLTSSLQSTMEPVS